MKELVGSHQSVGLESHKHVEAKLHQGVMVLRCTYLFSDSIVSICGSRSASGIAFMVII